MKLMPALQREVELGVAVGFRILLAQVMVPSMMTTP